MEESVGNKLFRGPIPPLKAVSSIIEIVHQLGCKHLRWVASPIDELFVYICNGLLN